MLNTSAGKFEGKAGSIVLRVGNGWSVQYSLPQAETEYSHQIDYQWDVATEDEKEILLSESKMEGSLTRIKNKTQIKCQFIKIL